jgi:2-methylcitrate dehydratase PrpD
MRRKSVMEQYGEFIATVDLSQLPAQVIHLYRRQILDAITTVVAGSRYPGGMIPARVAEDLDGAGRGGGPDSPEATVLASGARVAPSNAAFANAQASIATDTASNLYFSQGLPGACLFPALAVAESKHLAGRTIIEALAAGYEIAGRVALSMSPPYVPAERSDAPGVSTITSNYSGFRWIAFAGAASVAKILQLNSDEAANALAVSANVMLPPPIPDRTLNMSKYGLVGAIAWSSLMSGYMAGRGFTGDVRLLDNGNWHRAVGSNLADPDAMLRGLGETWLVREANFKRYPAGTHNQQALHALDQILRDGDLAADEVTEIWVGRAIGTSGAFTAAHPRTYVEAQFSLPFQCAALIGRIPHREWSEHHLDPDLWKIADRVSLQEAPEAVEEFAAASAKEPVRSPWWFRSLVKVGTKDGGEVERWSDYGEPTDDELVGKFRHYADGVIPSRSADAIVEMAFGIDQLDDVAHLCAEVAQRR